ncbi:MAG: MoaD/ThiS family protein [Spirochaetales bacterium]|nr:MoaD/ThiS family protein [Spirochaetales bacterium]
MNVRITAPPFCDHSRVDDSGFIKLKDEAKLNSLYKLLKVPLPLRPLLITVVNYERARPGLLLKDGDEVSIFWPLSGG